MGAEYLRKPEIKAYLQELTGKPEERRISTAIERQEWLTKMIDGRMVDHHVLSDGTVIKRPAKLADRIRAAELLARMCGELIDKHQHSGDVTVRTVIKRFDGN